MKNILKLIAMLIFAVQLGGCTVSDVPEEENEESNPPKLYEAVIGEWHIYGNDGLGEATMNFKSGGSFDFKGWGHDSEGSWTFNTIEGTITFIYKTNIGFWKETIKSAENEMAKKSWGVVETKIELPGITFKIEEYPEKNSRRINYYGYYLYRYY